MTMHQKVNVLNISLIYMSEKDSCEKFKFDRSFVFSYLLPRPFHCLC